MPRHSRPFVAAIRSSGTSSYWATIAMIRLATVRRSVQLLHERAWSFPHSSPLPHVMYANVVQLPGQVAGFLDSAYNPFQVKCRSQCDSTSILESSIFLVTCRLTGSTIGHRSWACLMAAAVVCRCSSLIRTPRPLARQLDSAACHRRTLIQATFTLRRLFACSTRRLSVRRFTLGAEDPKLRDRYGCHKLGQSVLLGSSPC